MSAKTLLAAAGMLVAAGAANAQFSGAYAPGNWTFNANGGDGSFTNDGSTLALTGNNNGTGAINTDYTINAAASGNFSFSWAHTSSDSGTWDSSYYLINGVQTFLSNNVPAGAGVVSVPVNMGDSIGFRVFSSDGAIGSATLTITNFSGPVPAPASLALLGLGGLVAGRRRR